LEKIAHTGINHEQFKEFAALPADTPVVMLNLLKFKENVAETGLSGAATYTEYMKASTPFFQKSKAEILYLGKPQRTLIGPEDEALWDKILLIRYPSIAAFIEMVTDKDYPSDMRGKALEDSRLIHCK